MPPWTTTFATKSGRRVSVRFSTVNDVDVATEFINAASREDTFLTFSGEQLSAHEERAYLQDCDARIANGDLVKLSCFIDDHMVADVTIGRDLRGRKRTYHCAILGIIVHKEYRGDGIGETLMRIAIDEARRVLSGVRIITLWFLAPNEAAKHLYEKIGFKECGRVPEGVWYRDAYVDHVHMMLKL